MTDFTLEDFERQRRPRRKLRGISALLLPFGPDGRIDEASFRRHLRRTLDAGLRIAVNMDTGYIDLLTQEEKLRVLDWTAEVAGQAGQGDWFAGARPAPIGEPSDIGYIRESETIVRHGGIPIIFPSAYTARLDDPALIGFFQKIASAAGRFLAFELGPMFNPHGRMFSTRVLGAVLAMPGCLGLKHSSLNRVTELERVRLRDRARPDFSIYSGNDLAADTVEYGSDYLLGLSTFAPELFVARDRAWAEGDSAYYELRDLIQYLGWVGFRDPVPAYKHSAAIFLKLTGGIDCDDPHPRAPRREDWDRALLAHTAQRCEEVMSRWAESPAKER